MAPILKISNTYPLHNQSYGCNLGCRVSKETEEESHDSEKEISARSQKNNKVKG